MRMKFDFSMVHLWTAQSLSLDAKEIEDALANNQEDKFAKRDILPRTVHDGYTSNSIISSAAFLEATINEFYDKMMNAAESWEADEGGANPFQEIVHQILLGIDEIEPRKFQNKPTLRKYQLLLVYTGCEPFQKGVPPFQSVRTVQGLRNDLIHFEPEWADFDAEVVQTPGNIPGKLELNPFYDGYREPESYLSYEIANWCLESVAEFVLRFYDQMGLAGMAKLSPVREILDEN
jgi:hypothetical protein